MSVLRNIICRPHGQAGHSISPKFRPHNQKGRPLAGSKGLPGFDSPGATLRTLGRLSDELGHADKTVFVPDTVLPMRRLLPDFYQPAAARRTSALPRWITPLPCVSSSEHQQYIRHLGEVCRYYHEKTGEEISLFTQVCSSRGMTTPSSLTSSRHSSSRWAFLFPNPRVSGFDGIHFRHWPAAGVHRCAHAWLHLCLDHAHAGVGLAYQPKFVGLYKLIKMEAWVRPLDDW